LKNDALIAVVEGDLAAQRHEPAHQACLGCFGDEDIAQTGKQTHDGGNAGAVCRQSSVENRFQPQVVHQVGPNFAVQLKKRRDRSEFLPRFQAAARHRDRVDAETFVRKDGGCFAFGRGDVNVETCIASGSRHLDTIREERVHIVVDEENFGLRVQSSFRQTLDYPTEDARLDCCAALEFGAAATCR
jgi:hypothetical protein